MYRPMLRMCVRMCVCMFVRMCVFSDNLNWHKSEVLMERFPKFIVSLEDALVSEGQHQRYNLRSDGTLRYHFEERNKDADTAIVSKQPYAERIIGCVRW